MPSVARAVRTWKPGLSTCHWYLAATCSVLVLPEECGGGFFWETTSGFIPVFSTVWFDSGYMCLSVYGGVGLAGCDAPRAVFLRGFQSLVCCIMAGMDQQEQFVYWSCLMCAGFLFLWEMTSCFLRIQR